MKKNYVKPMRVIATLPPYVSHRANIINHRLVDELRYNTINPLSGSREELVKRLKDECGDKPLWLDLKTRQLRIEEFSYLPFAFVKLSHKISVPLPAKIYFKDCVSTIAEIVDGNKLILDGRPIRVVGKGEAVNIIDPRLKIEGFLTDGDKEFIEAAKNNGLHRYMLSFTETPEDIEELRKLDPQAVVIAKIESLRGMDFAQDEYKKVRKFVRLMAARDDLFIQLKNREPEILKAVKTIVEADPSAIVASRILTSFEEKDGVAMGDIMDLELMRRVGFKTLMFSDTLCFREDVFKLAIGMLAKYFEEVGNG